MNRYVLFILLFLLQMSSFAQVIVWQNTIGGSAEENLYSFSKTTDGGFICGGYSASGISGDKTEINLGNFDYWVVKLDSLGNIQWQNTIGGSGADYLNSIAQTADGGYICGGVSESDISGDKTENSQGMGDYWVVKLDGFGNIQWQNTIGGISWDEIQEISQTTDGGYICGGRSLSSISGDKSENSQGQDDYWVVKLDGLGNIQWQNTIGGNFVDQLFSIKQTTDGGYICGGISYSPISGDKTENSMGVYDFWVIKLNSTGGIQWQNTIGGNASDILLSIDQTADGGYICGGYSESTLSGDKTEYSQGSEDLWIIKLDGSGNIQWQNTIGGNSLDEIYSIEPTTDGGYLCAAYSWSDISGDKTENSRGENDYWIIKLDISGNILWQKTIGGSNLDYCSACHEVNDGIVCAGHSRSGVSGDKNEICLGNHDYWIAKLSFNPNLIVENINADSFVLYPNPSTTDATVSFSLNKISDVEIQLTNTLSQIVYTRNKTFSSGKNDFVLPTSDLHAGIYHLQLTIDGVRLTKKLVKL